MNILAMKQPIQYSMRGHFCDHRFRVAEARPVEADCQTVSLKGGATTTQSAQTQLRVIAIGPLVYHRIVANCTWFQCWSDNGSWLLHAVRLRGLAPLGASTAAACSADAALNIGLRFAKECAH